MMRAFSYFPQGEEHHAVVGLGLLVKGRILEIEGVCLDMLDDIIIVDGFFHHRGGAAVRADGSPGGTTGKGCGTFGGQQRRKRDPFVTAVLLQWQSGVQITGKEAPV